MRLCPLPLVQCSYHLTSWSLLLHCKGNLRSYREPQQLTSIQCLVLERLLGSEATIRVTAEEPEVLQAARDLYGLGMIIPDETFGSDSVFRFSSPLHGMLAAHDFYGGKNPATTIPDLVRRMLSRMSPKVLQESEGRSKKTNNPLEGTYHHEAYRAMFNCLPEKAVLSVFVGQVSRIPVNMTVFE